MKETTQRQYDVWMKHLEEEWNRPNRTDHYLMVLAMEVRSLNATVSSVLGGRKHHDIHLDQFKINFKRQEVGPDTRTPEEKTEDAKARWFGRMTMPITFKTKINEEQDS